jgi:hypothetical protein
MAKDRRRSMLIQRLRQRLSRAQEQRDAVTALERKQDAREKILLGGIVVKAGLRTVDKAVLLGALLELATLDPTSKRYQHLKERGDAAFQRDPSG